ncbi:MAG: glycerophosphoryl diester phosphodiesterase [Ilumatobacteraceae bacterium]
MGWGAQAMEISTSSTSDGVLVCMHDLSYDRTTTGSGQIHAQSSSVLEGIGVRQAQLGPAWIRTPLPRVPLLQDVLRRFGGHAVLCMEAKRDSDYPAMMAMIENHGLQDSIIVKAFHTSPSIGKAKRSGYPVVAYLGALDTDEDTVRATAARLDPRTDYLALPTTRRQDAGAPLNQTVVRAAVDSGLPVWVYPVHRRSEADYFTGLGVQGIITSSVGYVTSRTASTAADTWNTGAIASGEMTRAPGSASWAPQWHSGGVTLAVPERQHFLTLGQFAPVPRTHSDYRIDFEARWDTLPSDRSSHLDLVFGHTDDRYYEHGLGSGNGYHAILRADGSLELFRHQLGSAEGHRLAGPVNTAAPAAGRWMRFSLRVSPDHISWARLDDGPDSNVTAANASYRGGYLHIGRTAVDPDSAVSFRNFRVT